MIAFEDQVYDLISYWIENCEVPDYIIDKYRDVADNDEIGTLEIYLGTKGRKYSNEFYTELSSHKEIDDLLYQSAENELLALHWESSWEYKDIEEMRYGR